MTYKEFIDKLVDYVSQSGDWKVQDLIPRMVFSNKVQTMGTNSHNIFINPDFAASLTMPQVVGVLWHEALHDLYDHHKVPWARYDVSSGLSPQQWHHLTNVAMDLIINDTVLASGQELPPDGIFREKFPYITDDMTTSHKVFKAMLQHLQEQNQNATQNPQAGSSSSSSSSDSNDEGEGGQTQQQVTIEISPDDPIAKAMANQAQQEEDDQAIANEPPQSPQDLDNSNDASNSSNSISEKEKNEKQSQIDEARQSIDDARNQLEDEEKKLQDRLNELNQDSTDDIKDEDDDEDNVGETDEDGQDEQEGSSDTASEKEDIENKLKELEDKRKELDEESDELDKMQEELDSLDTDDSEDDNSEEDNEEDSEDDSAEANDSDDSLDDNTPLSELLGGLVEEISTEVLRDLTAVDKTARVPIPALRDFQVTWIDKVFSRVGRYLAQQNRDRTFSRPARRNPYGLPDSEYKTPQKGSVIRDYKPTVCFYLDASGSMYSFYYKDGKSIEISRPEIIRRKLAQRAQLLKDTRSIVIPFSSALGKPIDVTAEFPYHYSDNFVSGTNLNNVINDINKNSFDVSVIITDATESLYIDKINRNRDVVVVLPNERSIVGDTSRRNIEIIQQEDLLE